MAVFTWRCFFVGFFEGILRNVEEDSDGKNAAFGSTCSI